MLREKARAVAAELKDFVPAAGQEWEHRATELIERFASTNNAELLKLYKERGTEIEKLEWLLQQSRDAMNQSGAMLADIEKTMKLGRRDHFAMAAMQGAIASGQWNSGDKDNAALLAPVCVRFADALLAVLGDAS